MTLLDEALDTHDWLGALGLALAAWRETRTIELADLIDTIDGQRARDAPSGRHHAWWMARAQVYDPAVVPALVTFAEPFDDGPSWTTLSDRGATLAATIEDVAGSAALRAGWKLSIIDRFAMIAAWPDDPRVADLLARWLTEMPCRWPGEVTCRFYGLLRDRLVALGDHRVVDRLAECASQASGHTGLFGVLQRRLAAEALAGLVPGSVEVAGDIAPRDDAALWREIARHPDDDAPRLVLADALTLRGDPRGEVITLQCAATRTAIRRANHLIKAHWYDWMDVLGLVITRTGSELRRGMLEVVHVGMHTTPAWAYDAVIGHRELAAVRTVRAHQLADADFVRFVDHLDHEVVRIGVIRKTMVRALRDVRPRWPFRAVEFALAYVDDATPMSFGATLEVLASIAPDLEEITLQYREYQLDDVVAQVTRLPAMFAKLTRIIVDPMVVGHTAEAALRMLPYVALRVTGVRHDDMPGVDADAD